MTARSRSDRVPLVVVRLSRDLCTYPCSFGATVRAMSHMAIKHEVHRTYTDRKLHRTPLERLKLFKSLRAVCSQRRLVLIPRGGRGGLPEFEFPERCRRCRSRWRPSDQAVGKWPEPTSRVYVRSFLLMPSLTSCEAVGAQATRPWENGLNPRLACMYARSS